MEINRRIPWLVFKRTLKMFWPKQTLTEKPPIRSGTRSVFIRYLDAGSANDNEIEIVTLSNPFYDFERYGFRLVASPRHADVLLVSLPLARNMLEPARATFSAMPEPRRVISIGDKGEDDSVFAGSYAIVPLPPDFTGKGYRHISARDQSGAEIFPPPAPDILCALLERDLSVSPDK